MKRFLLSLVAIVITSVCFAQDIIVQKDGSTIQAKVTKVTQSEVEYKKFNNQKGPTYAISTKDLQCINYENGTKDTFVSPNYNPNIVTNETATQFSNDEQLVNLYKQSNAEAKYKKGRTLRIIGYAVGGTMAAIGLVSLTSDKHSDETTGVNAGLLILGIASGTTLHFVGSSMQKKAKALINSATLYQQEFKVGKNDRLMVGVDMLKDNTRRNQTLGLGLSYNF